MIRSFIQTIPVIAFALILFSSCANHSGDSKGPASGTDTAKKDPPNAEAGALPYKLDFIPQQYNNQPPLPCLQSYVATMTKDGYLLIIGGRRQGLHTFESSPAHNFIPDSSNNFIFVIDPLSGSYWSFNVDSLSPTLSAPLQATNQQFYYDRATDQCYVVGGYGWNAGKTDMLTFNTIIRFQASVMTGLIKSGQPAAKIAGYIQLAQDDRLAVTGGALSMLNGAFYLVFGQNFMGQYRAFGGGNFTQKYTQEVRVFTLDRNTLKILSYGATTNTEPDLPFHRRDGNIIDDIDPLSGKLRITAFGGVFQQGVIAPYTFPVYINGPATPVVNRNQNQKFSQYECPVITMYDSSAPDRTVYHSFFGGIGHYYYFQTPSQAAAYDTVTNQGRNDGFPFVGDITTFLQDMNGNSKEYIHTDPIPANRLLGSSIKFIENYNLITNGIAYNNGVIKLAAIPTGARIPIGYIYGGIEAQNPLPLIPNQGTIVSNTVFAVYLKHEATAAIPAGYGHESIKREGNLHRK